MDRNSPDYYVEKTEESLTETQAFVNKVQFSNIHKQCSISQYLWTRFNLTLFINKVKFYNIHKQGSILKYS